MKKVNIELTLNDIIELAEGYMVVTSEEIPHVSFEFESQLGLILARKFFMSNDIEVLNEEIHEYNSGYVEFELCVNMPIDYSVDDKEGAIANQNSTKELEIFIEKQCKEV